MASSSPLLEINIPRFVSSVLPPTKVDQASVPEKSQYHVFPHYVRLSSLLCVLPGILIFQSGTGVLLFFLYFISLLSQELLHIVLVKIPMQKSSS